MQIRRIFSAEKSLKFWIFCIPCKSGIFASTRTKYYRIKLICCTSLIKFPKKYNTFSCFGYFRMKRSHILANRSNLDHEYLKIVDLRSNIFQEQYSHQATHQPLHKTKLIRLKLKFNGNLSFSMLLKSKFF